MTHRTPPLKEHEDKLRVLIVEPSGNLWGSERALLDLCDGLQSTEWQVGICCPPDTPIIPHITSAMGTVFPLYTANLHLRSKFARGIAAWNLRRVLKAFRPDVIYVNQAGATKVALAAATMTNVPVVSHIRLLKDADYIDPLKSRHRLNHLICISRFIEDACSEHGPGKVQLHTIFDGYQPVRNSPCKTETQNLVVCPGRFAHIKGQDVLLGAAARVHTVNPKVRFNFVGRADENTPFDQELQQLRKTLKMEHVVSLEPFADEIWPWLESADFLACPSRIEPLGRVIFEAWDAGIIPIAYRGSGGPAETIAAANAGILYDNQDPDCLAEAILRAYDIPLDKRAEMVRLGRRWMLDQIEPVTYAHRVSDVFKSALHDSPYSVAQ
ncbi:MAG TPA: glycosyltransferase [Planctomycetes bacterium]|nr:glycosyltransferase [Fuerstiella sp.]HIK92255.1 glycosyltransferase [Planctomycetota bacterium]